MLFAKAIRLSAPFRSQEDTKALLKWGCPKMGVPLVIIHFHGIFHEINQPAIGYPQDHGNLQIFAQERPSTSSRMDSWAVPGPSNLYIRWWEALHHGLDSADYELKLRLGSFCQTRVLRCSDFLILSKYCMCTVLLKHHCFQSFRRFGCLFVLSAFKTRIRRVPDDLPANREVAKLLLCCL